MILQNMYKDVQTSDGCPICGARIKHMETEPHPDRSRLEIHGYSCTFCGPVMFLVVRCSVEQEPELLMLM
jgi:hypothetical protein